MSVWAIDPDGSHRVRLAPDGPAGDPSWSGDATRVLVKRWGDTRGTGLWWIDVASRGATPTGIEDAGVRSARPSPDSQSVAFHLIESDGSMDVWTQSLNGAPPRRVTHDPEAASYPVWSPDGRWLAVEVKRGERTQVGVVDKDGGQIELLTDDPGQNWPHAWSPDGERITYAAERGAVWNIWEVSRRLAPRASSRISRRRAVTCGTVMVPRRPAHRLRAGNADGHHLDRSTSDGPIHAN